MNRVIKENVELLKDTMVIKYPYFYTYMQKKKLADNKTNEYRVTYSKLTLPSKSGLLESYPLVIFDSKHFEMFLKNICYMNDEETETILNTLGVKELKRKNDKELKKKIRALDKKEKEYKEKYGGV